MAKYLGQTEHPVITDSAIRIVDDAYSFLSSESCNEWFILPGAHASSYRHVKIYSHRRCGLSTTSLKLLDKYPHSLIITHNHPAADSLRRFAIEKDLVPEHLEEEFYNNILINNHIISHGRIDDRWFTNRRPEKKQYQLIILDSASMIEHDRDMKFNEEMNRFRTHMWEMCDLLVELG